MSLPAMPSIVQIAVGAAMTSLSEPALASAGFWVGLTVADVTGSRSLFSKKQYGLPPAAFFQRPASLLSRGASRQAISLSLWERVGVRGAPQQGAPWPRRSPHPRCARFNNSQRE